MKRSGIDENDADVSASSSPPTADITELASCWYRPSIIHKHNGNMEPRPAAAAERKNPLPDWISYLLLLLFSSFPPPSKQQQQQQQPKSTKDFSSALCNVWWDCLYYCRCSVLRQSLLQDCFTTIISLSLSLVRRALYNGTDVSRAPPSIQVTSSFSSQYGVHLYILYYKYIFLYSLSLFFITASLSSLWWLQWWIVTGTHQRVKLS